MLLLPPAKLTKEEKFYVSFNERGINLIDRVNGKPIWVYHYSIDRPNANWKAPKRVREDWELEDDDNEEDWELEDD